MEENKAAFQKLHLGFCLPPCHARPAARMPLNEAQVLSTGPKITVVRVRKQYAFPFPGHLPLHDLLSLPELTCRMLETLMHKMPRGFPHPFWGSPRKLWQCLDLSLEGVGVGLDLGKKPSWLVLCPLLSQPCQGELLPGVGPTFWSPSSDFT